MKTIPKISVIVITLLLMFMVDMSILMVDLVPDANALFGVRRRMVRRSVIVGSAASNSANAATNQQQTATAQQESATAQQQSATAQQQSATAQQQATAKPSVPQSGATLPLGTIVNALPAGCTQKAVGKVEYYYCGGNYYRTAFQGNNLVYVTAQP